MNLSRPINSTGDREHGPPKLIVFKSYSPEGGFDAGNLVERLLLDGEINLSRPPPTPSILFLVISSDGTQIPLENGITQICIARRSYIPITELINSEGNKNSWQSTNTNDGKGQHKKLAPLFHFRTTTHDPSLNSSPTMPLLTPMMRKR
jgi:hypothetical protein